ncbi:MAG: DUF969 domain-containing protein [Telmatospirillum sp.]|nr:DUF969 domain-containing protein [Telmatospirillum sp.]
MTLTEILPLVGLPLIIGGFAFGFNPLAVVVGSGVVTGLAAGLSPDQLLQLIGEKFLASRQLAIFVLILPVSGVLERHGLRQRAETWIAGIREASAGRILMLYLVLREGAAGVGLLSLGGQVQTVRPLLAPMAEGAAEARYPGLAAEWRERIRAQAAATDNIGAFFGEDIFIAFGGVLLMDAFLKDNGITGIEPLQIGLWAIPTAVSALGIQMVRLARLDRALARASRTGCPAGDRGGTGDAGEAGEEPSS